MAIENALQAIYAEQANILQELAATRGKVENNMFSPLGGNIRKLKSAGELFLEVAEEGKEATFRTADAVIADLRADKELLESLRSQEGGQTRQYIAAIDRLIENVSAEAKAVSAGGYSSPSNLAAIRSARQAASAMRSAGIAHLGSIQANLDQSVSAILEVKKARTEQVIGLARHVGERNADHIIRSIETNTMHGVTLPEEAKGIVETIRQSVAKEKQLRAEMNALVETALADVKAAQLDHVLLQSHVTAAEAEITSKAAAQRSAIQEMVSHADEAHQASSAAAAATAKVRSTEKAIEVFKPAYDKLKKSHNALFASRHQHHMGLVKLVGEAKAQEIISAVSRGEELPVLTKADLPERLVERANKVIGLYAEDSSKLKTVLEDSDKLLAELRNAAKGNSEATALFEAACKEIETHPSNEIIKAEKMLADQAGAQKVFSSRSAQAARQAAAAAVVKVDPKKLKEIRTLTAEATHSTNIRVTRIGEVEKAIAALPEGAEKTQVKKLFEGIRELPYRRGGKVNAYVVLDDLIKKLPQIPGESKLVEKLEALRNQVAAEQTAFMHLEREAGSVDYRRIVGEIDTNIAKKAAAFTRMSTDLKPILRERLTGLQEFDRLIGEAHADVMKLSPRRTATHLDFTHATSKSAAFFDQLEGELKALEKGPGKLKNAADRKHVGLILKQIEVLRENIGKEAALIGEVSSVLSGNNVHNTFLSTFESVVTGAREFEGVLSADQMEQKAKAIKAELPKVSKAVVDSDNAIARLTRQIGGFLGQNKAEGLVYQVQHEGLDVPKIKALEVETEVQGLLEKVHGEWHGKRVPADEKLSNLVKDGRTLARNGEETLSKVLSDSRNAAVTARDKFLQTPEMVKLKDAVDLADTKLGLGAHVEGLLGAKNKAHTTEGAVKAALKKMPANKAQTAELVKIFEGEGTAIERIDKMAKLLVDANDKPNALGKTSQGRALLGAMGEHHLAHRDLETIQAATEKFAKHGLIEEGHLTQIDDFAKRPKAADAIRGVSEKGGMTEMFAHLEEATGKVADTAKKGGDIAKKGGGKGLLIAGGVAVIGAVAAALAFNDRPRGGYADRIREQQAAAMGQGGLGAN